MGALSDAFENDPDPQARIFEMAQAQEAREAAAARTKQTVAPGDRPTIPIPEHLQSYGNFAGTVGQGLKETATDLFKHPENLVDAGPLGGIVRGAGRSVAERLLSLSPAQIQERLSQLNRDLSRGRIGEAEYQQGRQGLGLPPASPDRIAPLSAAAPPRQTFGTMSPAEFAEWERNPRSTRAVQGRDPTDRTMAELSAQQGALPSNLSGGAYAHIERMRQIEEERSKPRVGVLGGDQFARQAFDKIIAPTIDEKTFATKYFDGMFSQNIKMSTNVREGDLHFNGPLFRGGQGKVGKIERTILPNEQRAYHNYFELEPHVQGGGIAKSLMRNQFDIYQQLGIKRVDLSANIDVGGYSWAKYGFVPVTQGPGGWFGLQKDLMERLRYLRSPGRDMAERMIATSDPTIIWAIADLQHSAQNIRYGQRNADTVPLGKALLLGQDWRGTFDLTSREQMDKFNAYVKR